MQYNLGAIARIGSININPFRVSIAPAHEDIHAFATVQSLKRGSRREVVRPSSTFIGNRVVAVRWVA